MLNQGDTFGDYRVVRLLGQGGMGAVYLLENDEGGQIAAKILDKASSSDHESRKRFLHEAQLALGVKHPNLVETYDVGEDPDTGLCYILMEYVPGGSLADRIEQQGPLPIRDAIRIVYQIASVLEFAQQKGVVHRDIKPANIMFAADGTAKLADLGIARRGIAGTETTTVTQTGMMLGTPAYMAPEQMLDAHNVDIRADIYSLGIVFYEMLAGERPNADDTIVQLMAKAVKGEPLPDVRTLRPEVSAALAELIGLMTEKYVAKRISTPAKVMEIVVGLEDGGAEIQLKSPTLIAAASHDAVVRGKSGSCRRRRRMLRSVTLVSVLALAFAVCGGLAVWRGVCAHADVADVPGDALLLPAGFANLAECGVCLDVSRGATIVDREDFIAQFCGGEDAGLADFMRCPFGIDGQALASANLLLLFASSPQASEYAPRELEAMDAFLRRGGSIVAFTCGCNVRLMESLFSRYGAHLRGLSGAMSVRGCGEMSASGPISGRPMVCVVPESGANGAAWQTLADSGAGAVDSVIGGRRVGRGRLFYAYKQMVGHSESGSLNAEWWRSFLPRCVDPKGMDAGIPDRRNVADMSDVGFNVGELEILAPARFELQAKALTELMVGLDDVKPTADFRGFLLVDSATHSGGAVGGYSLVGAHFKGFPARSDEMRMEILKRIRKMKGERDR